MLCIELLHACSITDALHTADVGSNLTFQSPIPTDHRGNGCLTREFNVDVPVTPFNATPTTSAYETSEGSSNDVGMTIGTEVISPVKESSSIAALGTSSNQMVTGRFPLTIIQRGSTVVVGSNKVVGVDVTS